jgi:hypothetical protein
MQQPRNCRVRVLALGIRQSARDRSQSLVGFSIHTKISRIAVNFQVPLRFPKFRLPIVKSHFRNQILAMAKIS